MIVLWTFVKHLTVYVIKGLCSNYYHNIKLVGNSMEL